MKSSSPAKHHCRHPGAGRGPEELWGNLDSGLRRNDITTVFKKILTARKSRNGGFTMVELIMVIVLLGILSAVAVSRWPTGMKEEAARRELKRAFRYAQHKAITRDFDPTAPWGLQITGGAYTVQRSGTNCSGCPDDPGCGEAEYCNRHPLGDSDLPLTGPAAVWFNGLGEPIAGNGTPLAGGTYLVAGLPLTFCPETGYVQEGTSCP